MEQPLHKTNVKSVVMLDCLHHHSGNIARKSWGCIKTISYKLLLLVVHTHSLEKCPPFELEQEFWTGTKMKMKGLKGEKKA